MPPSVIRLDDTAAYPIQDLPRPRTSSETCAPPKHTSATANNRHSSVTPFQVDPEQINTDGNCASQPTRGLARAADGQRGARVIANGDLKPVTWTSPSRQSNRPPWPHLLLLQLLVQPLLALQVWVRRALPVPLRLRHRCVLIRLARPLPLPLQLQ